MRSRGQASGREFALASSLAAIVDSSADAIVSASMDHRITTWNPAAARMFGWTGAEIIGQPTALLIPPGQAAALIPVFERVRRGEDIPPFETQLRRKDGSLIDVWLSDSPIRGASGAVTGVSAILRDLTEQKQAAAERARLEARLRQAERLESLGQLAGSIAHDFNNLLSAILSFATFVAEESADRPGVRSDAEQIELVARHAARLTRQLLIFGRREQAQPQVLDLNAIVTELHSLLRRSAGPLSVLRTVLAPGLPPIRADRGQVEQALVNLAINARDAMPEGGTLTIRTGAADLAGQDAGLHPAIRPGRYVELAVSDTGTGMAPQTADRIFEPFFTTKPPGRGTGLGLSTVYGIMAGGGGGLGVDTAPGAGTTFRLYFPAAATGRRSWWWTTSSRS